MRGEDVTLWISTSSWIVNRLMKRAGDRWSRRFITTTAHQTGGSPANAVDGEKKKEARLHVFGDAVLVSCILIFPRRPRSLGLRCVGGFILSYVSYIHTP